MAMGTWKTKIIRKTRGSQTPGRLKGESCQADFLKKFYARSSRSYKDAGYGDWCRKMDVLNKMGGK